MRSRRNLLTSRVLIAPNNGTFCFDASCYGKCEFEKVHGTSVTPVSPCPTLGQRRQPRRRPSGLRIARSKSLGRWRRLGRSVAINGFLGTHGCPLGGSSVFRTKVKERPLAEAFYESPVTRTRPAFPSASCAPRMVPAAMALPPSLTRTGDEKLAPPSLERT